VLAYGRDVLGIGRIVAITDPDNRASIRVLEKIGLRRERTWRDPADDVELLLFAPAS
jgi:RimJ/RimL family protein N-acetyltransferase